MKPPSRLLAEALPIFSAELVQLLQQDGESELAEQIPSLRIVDRCRCGDDFCSTFYVAPPPRGSYGPGHENIVLDPAIGMIVLDVVEGRIMCVEVLYRDDVRQALRSLYP